MSSASASPAGWLHRTRRTPRLRQTRAAGAALATLATLTLLTAAPAMAQDASRDRTEQVLDPYAASPTGNPVAGTLGTDVSKQGTREGTRATPLRGGSGWGPGAGKTSIGLNLGRSKFDLACDPGFPCDDQDTYAALSARSMATDTFGGEIALVHMGRMERGGGHTRATGLNLSLVGKTPPLSGPAAGLGAFGKIGGLWGRTRTGLAPSSSLGGGTEHGFGLSLGAGLSWDFNPRMAAVLEWDRYWFRFAGSGRDPVNATSVGLQWRY